MLKKEICLSQKNIRQRTIHVSEIHGSCRTPWQVTRTVKLRKCKHSFLAKHLTFLKNLLRNSSNTNKCSSRTVKLRKCKHSFLAKYLTFLKNLLRNSSNMNKCFFLWFLNADKQVENTRRSRVFFLISFYVFRN